MAATNEERRKVAMALRGDPNDTLIPQVRDGFESMTYHEAAYRFWHMCRRIKSAADIDIAHSTTSWLAKLIDPTCEVVGITSDRGPYYPTVWHYRLSCGHTYDSEGQELPDYCPYCGARVVSDDDQ